MKDQIKRKGHVIVVRRSMPLYVQFSMLCSRREYTSNLCTADTTTYAAEIRLVQEDFPGEIVERIPVVITTIVETLPLESD